MVSATGQAIDSGLCRTEYRSKGKKKKKTDQTDYYALLGLQQERWTATEQQIKLGKCTTTLLIWAELLYVGGIDCTP